MNRTAKDSAIFTVTRRPSPSKPGQSVLGKRKRAQKTQLPKTANGAISQNNEGSVTNAKELQSLTFYDSTKVTTNSGSKRQRTDKFFSSHLRQSEEGNNPLSENVVQS